MILPTGRVSRVRISLRERTQPGIGSIKETNGLVTPTPHPSITQLLHQMHEGDATAKERLFVLIYDELYKMARLRMRGQKPDHTLQPTALVNEAYLKLFREASRAGAKENAGFNDRQHFLSLASRAMRSILVDHARKKNTTKRKPTGESVPLDELTERYEVRTDLVALDDCLKQLAEIDEAMVRVVELRFFGGMDMIEIADVMALSEKAVRQNWLAARAWLRRAMK